MSFSRATTPGRRSNFKQLNGLTRVNVGGLVRVGRVVSVWPELEGADAAAVGRDVGEVAVLAGGEEALGQTKSGAKVSSRRPVDEGTDVVVRGQGEVGREL